MPRSELFKVISPEIGMKKTDFREIFYSADPPDLATNQEGISTVLGMADNLRQDMALLRVSLEYPGIQNLDPQELLDRMDDTIHAHVLAANDRAIARKLRIPVDPTDLKSAISKMPPHHRM